MVITNFKVAQLHDNGIDDLVVQCVENKSNSKHKENEVLDSVLYKIMLYQIIAREM